jgi:hypothetical protein
MIYTQLWRFRCDNVNHDGPVQEMSFGVPGEAVTRRSLKRARRLAYEKGWRSVDNHDFCAECVERAVSA